MKTAYCYVIIWKKDSRRGDYLEWSIIGKLSQKKF